LLLLIAALVVLFSGLAVVRDALSADGAVQCVTPSPDDRR
jgi:hypothetical protein